MNKKSKKTLKNAFNIPEPTQKDSFFNNLEKKKEKNFMPFVRAYLPAVITAVAVIGIWGGIRNLPRFEAPEITDSEYSATTAETHGTHADDYILTTVSESGTRRKQSAETTKTVRTEPRTATQTTTAEEPQHTETTVKSVADGGKPPVNIIEFFEYYEYSEETQTATQTTQATRRTVTATRTTVATSSTSATTQKTTAVQTVSQSTQEDSPVTTTTTVSNFTPNVDIAPATTTQKPSDYMPLDFTVKPDVQYHVTDGKFIDIKDLTEQDDIPNVPSTSDETNASYEPYKLWKSLAEKSDLIVIATVDEVIYTDVGGTPYTQENITVNEVIYGDIPEKSRISVYAEGGFMPADKYADGTLLNSFNWLAENNYMILDLCGSSSIAEEGDTFLYFIRKNDGNFPDGSYFLTKYTDISKYLNTGDFYRNANKRNMTLYLSELIEFLN